MYDRFRRLVFEVEDLGGFFLFFGAGFVEVNGAESGEPSREAEPPKPAASRKLSTRSSSPASLITADYTRHSLSPKVRKSCRSELKSSGMIPNFLLF